MGMDVDKSRESKKLFTDTKHVVRAWSWLLSAPIVLASATLAAQAPPPPPAPTAPAPPAPAPTAPAKKPGVSVEISDPAPPPGRSPLPDTAPMTGIAGEEESAEVS